MLDIDQRFLGPNYAFASQAGACALRRLAASDAIFLDPSTPPKASQASSLTLPKAESDRGKGRLLHTGDAINLFENDTNTGHLQQM